MSTTYTNINYDSLNQSGKLRFDDSGNEIASSTYNLINIIPNPLYNNYLNDKFNNKLYVTSDFNGVENTSYLLNSQTNIANNIRKDMYLPSIGELGIAVENISLINEKIREVCYTSYNILGFGNLEDSINNCIISYNTTIPSSSLYSSNTQNYTNNVWCIDTEKGKISYVSIGTQFNIIPFYIYK